MTAALKLFNPSHFSPSVPAAIPASPDDPTLAEATDRYCLVHRLKKRTVAEYRVTVRAWERWLSTHRSERPMGTSQITRQHLEDFLCYVESETRERGSTNAENVRNKHRRHLRSVLGHVLHAACPPLPAKVKQRSIGSLHWYRDDDVNALYQAAGQLDDHVSWDWPCSRAQCWQTAIVLWTNLGIDTALLFPVDGLQAQTALRVRNFIACTEDPFGSGVSMPYGCLVFDRAKTGYEFLVPLNATMRRHLDLVLGDRPDPERLLLRGGCARRPCRFFQSRIVAAAQLRPKLDRLRGEVRWQLRDFRNTAAQRAMPFGLATAQAVLGHAPSNVLQRHYAETVQLLVNYFVGSPDQPAVSQPAAFG